MGRGAKTGMVGGALLILGLASGATINAAPPEATAVPQKNHGPVSRPLYVTKAPIIMLKDVESGAILFSRGTDKSFPPASMTKVMTAYVVLDLIKEGKLKASDHFEMTETVWKIWQARSGYSSMFLKPGDSVSIENLLLGLLAVSGNDAATLLATGIDGSEAAFTQRMNRVATEIGMTNSKFGTASGWPDGGATMVTAEDMIRLSERLIREHPEAYARYFSQPSFQHGVSPDGTPIVQRNRNPLLGRFEGADGLKTGYTDAAGYCLLGSAKRDGRRLIMIVAGMDSAQSRRDEAERLMTWGFEAWEGRVIAQAQSPIWEMDVDQGSAPRLTATNGMAIHMTVPRGHSGAYKAWIKGSTPVRAPVRQGDPIAQFIVAPAGLPAQSTPLIAAEAIEKGGALNRARTGLYRMTGL